MAAIKLKTKPQTAVAAEPLAPLKGSESSCLIAKGTHIEGKISAKEHLRIDGSLEGDVHCEQRLVLGKEGRITGNVQVQAAVIAGQLIGDLRVEGSLQLTGTARVEGNISAKHLVVEEGAVYHGRCSTTG